MTIEEFEALRDAHAKARKRNKYGARKSGGYDSRKECRRASVPPCSRCGSAPASYPISANRSAFS